MLFALGSEQKVITFFDFFEFTSACFTSVLPGFL